MFSYTLRVVILGGALLGTLSGIIGSFAVLRKQSLMGDVISHAALPGVGIAFLIAGRDLKYLLLGATITSLVGVWCISFITRMTRLKQDSAMGIILSGWFAAGIGILTFIQQGKDASQAGLNSFIFGQAAAIVRRDVDLLIVVSLVIVLLLIVNWKEFKIITFDREFAQANGIRVGFMTTLLMGMIVTTVVMGLQLAGVVLMVGLLIAPGIAARQWTDRLERMVILAGIIGAISAALGALLSALDADIPTGPMIIMVVSLFVLVSILFAPRRGIIITQIRQYSDRIRFAANNVRKATWRYALSHAKNLSELLEPSKMDLAEASLAEMSLIELNPDEMKAISENFLVSVLGPRARHAIRQLLIAGELKQKEAGYVLTEKGIAQLKEQFAPSPNSQQAVGGKSDV